MVALTAMLIVLGGCGGGTSACVPPPTAPATLSGGDRRDPAVATDGGARAVAVWESNTGGPVEASMRTADRTWTASTSLSRAGARDPSVAMDPAGDAIAVWERQPVGMPRTIEASTAGPDGTWRSPVMVSAPGASAHDARVAVDGTGRAVVAWRRDTTGADAVIEVAEERADGTWGMPHAISAGGARARRPRLAVAPNGEAAIVWEQRVDRNHAVAAATRDAAGTWSGPALVSAGVRGDQEPDVAIGPLGFAVAVWIGRDDAGIGVFAAEHADGSTWSAPQAVGRGSDRPRELARPGRADTGADVAVLPDGRAVVAWTVVQDDANRLGTAIRDADGRWSAPAGQPGAGGPAGGVQVAPVAGGGALLAWEELDGGLIRARVQRITAGDGAERCADLSSARSETGGVRLAGGSDPAAVFIDFNRGRVRAADVR